MNELRWMLPPLAMCLVLVGVHGYLGIHVLTRKVIFVDLALAQIAALGTVYAVLLGYDANAPGDAATVYGFSLAFTVLGAAVFAFTRMRHEKVPHEALIGICYATASALAMLILSKTPGEGEHLKSMLVGNILLVSWPSIVKTAALYGAVGLVHVALHRKFLAISEDPEQAAASGMNVRGWDFLFYLTFGLVITSSVAIAGVLLVFTYLVVPASFAMLFVDSFGRRLALAWLMGTACSVAGMAVSYYGDLPTGPAIVGVFAMVLILGGVVRAIAQASRPGRAALAVIVGGLLFAGIVRASTFLRKPEAEHTHASRFEQLLEVLKSGNETSQIEAIHHLGDSGDPHAAEALVALLSRNPSDRVLEHVAEALAELGDVTAVPALIEAGGGVLDPDLRLSLAEAVFRLHDPRGLTLVVVALRDDPALLARERARELLRRYLGRDFGYGPEAPGDARREAVERIEEWWAREGGTVRWQKQKKRFE